MTVATTEPNEMGSFDQNDEQVARYLGLNPNSPADRAMVAVCRHYDFDPLLKHVVVIPKGGVYITRDGLLHVAHRSGQLDGIVVEQPPTFNQETGEWEAVVSVYRKDMGHPFRFPGRYPAKGTNRDYAQEMALKAAESHALRRAFDVTGMPALDERRPEAERPSREPSRGLAAALSKPSPAQDDPGPDANQSASSPPNDEASAGEAPFDYRSSWARGTFFPALRAAEQGGLFTDAKEFMSEVAGRDVGSSKDLTEAEARMVVDNLPAAPTEDGPVDGEVVDA